MCPAQIKHPTKFANGQFDQDLRYRCRNDRAVKANDGSWRPCRSKLANPTPNPREAFCCRGCYETFHLKRCRVCERPIDQPKTGVRIICKRAPCRNAWRAGIGFGKYVDKPKPHQASPAAEPLRESAVKWALIAGSPPPENQFYCATVPDGHNRQWKGGSYERLEAANRAALKATDDALKAIDADYFREPSWREIVSPDGVRCWVTGGRPRSHGVPSDWRPCSPSDPIPDDLNIPSFLRRTS